MSKLLSRIDFLRNLGRGGLLLSLGGIGAAALHGTKDPSECFNHNYCSSCFSFSGCSLPEKIEVTETNEVTYERNEDIRPA